MINRILLQLFLVLLLFSCKREKTPEVNAINKPIDEYVYAPGEINWQNEYFITAETDGVLGNLSVKEGSFVYVNQIIGKINNQTNSLNKSTTAQQLNNANDNISSNSPQFKQLEEKIKIAEVKYKQDHSVADRYKRLFEKESVAKLELENANLTAENSLSVLQNLKDQLAQIKSDLFLQQSISKNSFENSKVVENFNLVKSSQKGKVLKLLKQKGDFVRRGEIIAQIGDESDISVVINIDDTNINRIKIGQTVYIKLNTNKEKIYIGKISEILPLFDELNQTFTCKVALISKLDFTINKTQLEANVLTNRKKSALLIPRDFLINGNSVILKETKDTIEIKTGIVSNDWVEVLNGLSKTQVIIKPVL